MTLPEWVSLVCRDLGVDEPELKPILDLARDVAHGVERPAAPVTTLLAGLAAGQGRPLSEVIDRIRSLLPAEPE